MGHAKSAGKRPSAGGRPALPLEKKKKHPVTLKFDEEELRLVNRAAKKDGNDRRANWVKRAAVMRAREILGLVEVAADPPPA
jgi:uncharacterized protein (DUF1778 family)